MDKLKSRKLWMTVFGSAVVAFGEQFGIELDTEQIIAISGMILAYLGTQGVIDKNADVHKTD